MKKTIAYLAGCLMAALLLVACDDEARFSSDPQYQLHFSADTLKMDTLFSQIGSPTYCFMIYNRNSVSLNIASVRQRSGGTSGFRVNIDGQFATDFEAMEIRAKDSLYAFVEVTPPLQGSADPCSIQDELTFTLESGRVQSVVLQAGAQDARFLHAPRFSGIDTLFAGMPYVIYDSLVVDSSALLTIEAGARLCFHQGAQCIVYGTLQAVGTRQQPILFRGDRTDRMFSYLPYDRVPGQWGGIRIMPPSYLNNFVYCDIHAADYGIKAEAGDINFFKLNIENCMIQNVKGNALELELCNGYVGNSLITNAGGHCVSLLGGYIDFVHCTLANFYTWSQKGAALYLTNLLEETLYPLYGVNFYNCLITGYTDDEVMGTVAEKSDSVDYSEYANYLFKNCLINSSDSTGTHFVDIVWERDSCEVVRGDNFRGYRINDFHLDSLSSARGAGAQRYAAFHPLDLDGVARPSASGAVDAGCYQFVPAQGGGEAARAATRGGRDCPQ